MTSKDHLVPPPPLSSLEIQRAGEVAHHQVGPNFPCRSSSGAGTSQFPSKNTDFNFFFLLNKPFLSCAGVNQWSVLANHRDGFGSQAAPAREEKSPEGHFSDKCGCQPCQLGLFPFLISSLQLRGHHTVSTQPKGAAGHDHFPFSLFPPSVYPLPADSCSMCLSNFSQQISLAGVYSVHL